MLQAVCEKFYVKCNVFKCRRKRREECIWIKMNNFVAIIALFNIFANCISEKLIFRNKLSDIAQK